MKRTSLLLSFCSIFLLTGCELLPTYIVNELSIIQGYGYDLSKDNELKGVYQYPVYKGPNEPPLIETISGEGKTSKETRSDANMKVRHPLVSGQIRLFLIGKSLAKKGVYSVLDTVNRDPAIGTLIQLAITEGETKDILTMKAKNNENMGLAIQEMLEQNMDQGKLPRSDFNTYMYQYYQIGIDPYLPIIKLNNEDIEISGIGIFKDDQLKTNLSKEYFFIFKSLVEKNKIGIQQFSLKNGQKLVIDNIKSSPKIKVKTKNGVPIFNIHVKMLARIQEYSGQYKTPLPKQSAKFSKEIEQKLEKDGLSIINKFKENNVDPIGFGAKFKAHNRKFNKKKWEEQYPDAKVHLTVSVKIIRTGIMD